MVFARGVSVYSYVLSHSSPVSHGSPVVVCIVLLMSRVHNQVNLGMGGSGDFRGWLHGDGTVPGKLVSIECEDGSLPHTDMRNQYVVAQLVFRTAKFLLPDINVISLVRARPQRIGWRAECHFQICEG